MNQELIVRLQQLQRTAAAVGDLIRQAGACAPPRVQGTDSSAAIRVTLGADGVPTAITVVGDWPRRIGSASLATAVLQASHRAVQVRLQLWTQALHAHGWDQRAHMMTSSDDVAAHVNIPQLFRPGQQSAPARPVGDLAEELINACNQARTYDMPTPQFQGANKGRTVLITLTAGALTGCTIKSGWAEGRSGAVVSAALRDALFRARRALHRAAATPAAAQRLDSLFEEAVSVLGDPQRLAGA
jgi:hypothetical protein